MMKTLLHRSGNATSASEAVLERVLAGSDVELALVEGHARHKTVMWVWHPKVGVISEPEATMNWVRQHSDLVADHAKKSQDVPHYDDFHRGRMIIHKSGQGAAWAHTDNSYDNIDKSSIPADFQWPGLRRPKMHQPSIEKHLMKTYGVKSINWHRDALSAVDSLDDLKEETRVGDAMDALKSRPPIGTRVELHVKDTPGHILNGKRGTVVSYCAWEGSNNVGVELDGRSDPDGPSYWNPDDLVLVNEAVELKPSNADQVYDLLSMHGWYRARGGSVFTHHEKPMDHISVDVAGNASHFRGGQLIHTASDARELHSHLATQRRPYYQREDVDSLLSESAGWLYCHHYYGPNAVHNRRTSSSFSSREDQVESVVTNLLIGAAQMTQGRDEDVVTLASNFLSEERAGD